MTSAEIGGIIILVLNLFTVVVAVYKLGRAIERFENIGEQQAVEISELKRSMASVGDILTKMAVSTERLDNISARLGRQEQKIDELAHGEGFIFPLKPVG